MLSDDSIMQKWMKDEVRQKMRKSGMRRNYYGENNFTKKVVYYVAENAFRERMENERETHLQLLQEMQDPQRAGIVVGTPHDYMTYGGVLNGAH